MSLATHRVNTYFAVLMVTVIGAGASLLIIHIANASERLFEQSQLGKALSEY